MKLMKLFFSATAVCLLLATSGAAMAELEFTGCLKDNGKLKRVAPGEFPTKACKKKETRIQFPSQEQIDLLKGLETAALEITVDCGGGDVLQDAINEALPFTTILVDGTCNENINIGPGKVGLTIDGQGFASIAADEASGPAVTIRGRDITIRNFGGLGDNSINGGARGIVVTSSASARIQSNTVERAASAGITVEDNSSATITGNRVRLNNGNGIAIKEDSSAQIGSDCTEETENRIIANGQSGVALNSNSEANIIGNSISGNATNGIFVADSSMADTASNDIGGNQADGILLRRGSSLRLGRPDTPDEACPDDPNESTINNVNFGLNCQSLSTVDGELGSLTGNAGDANLRNENTDCPDCCFTSLD